MGAAIPREENTLTIASRFERIERERRFLLRSLPEPLTRASEHVQIWDNYVTNTRLRLRKMRVPKTNEYILTLTQKYPLFIGDLSRFRVNDTNLSAAEYNVLAVFEGNEIRKNRYPFEYDGRAYVIDIFIGALWGLLIAKTRFETDVEMDAFAAPPFVVQDISNDAVFSGAQLVDQTADGIREVQIARGTM
jgi:CYTH domain-containing protein